MQSSFAFGLAKNGVSGLPSVRRAATASQIGGRLPSPGSPVSAGSDAFDEAASGSPASLATATAAMPRVASSPTAFADLGSDQAALATKAAAARAGGVARKASEAAQSGDELHPIKRGTSVDKTNPFIGYFQTGTEENDALAAAVAGAARTSMPSPPPAPVRRVPIRTQSSATLSSMSSFYPSAFFTPQKKTTDWLGSQGSRFPTFFKQRDAKESAQQKQQQDEQKKRAAFLESLRLETPALATEATTDETQEQQENTSFKRTVSMPATMSAKAAAAALPPIVTSSSEVKPTATTSILTSGDDDTCSSNSRFEQDFEVVGSLGEGGQGSVFKVRSKVDGCYYAIKKVVLPRATELDAKRAESQALREVRLMASMAPHSNVVRYHTAWTEVDACVPHKSSSTESVRGSDVSSMESDCGPQDLQRQQLELLDEEAELRMGSTEAADQSFSLEFSSNSLSFDEYSTPGFTFEDDGEDEDSVGLCVDDEATFGKPGELKSEVSGAPRDIPAEPVAMKSQVILYIQMELCGTAVNSVPSTPTAASSHEPIHHILDQLKAPQQERQQFGEETHSNLGAWLRSSLEERSAWSNTSEIHQEGLKLFIGAVQGVAHMHSYGVIHRDLKPDNIFIHGDLAKIGDFGLSKSVFVDSSSDGSVSPRERLQELGLSDGDHTTALGTFTYASPEQLGYRFSSSNLLKNAATRLKSAKYSIKSDIFALGVILLELCCPFSTMMERSQVLTGVRHGVVPQKARQHFPMEMDLVLRMTSIDPGERPTSEEVCEQLRKIMAASSTTVTPASALEELRELQAKLAAAVRQVRDRSQATLQLEALVSELNEKVQNVGIALA
ncbi:Eukaryotic translation initiation factor 2-alpha kinase [Phytophthora pseudosyringae]|uniref:non-specific serine/threonine protein kinase n=1 Tax=Phytophthora pseudosyringae TaxID=221518 RepID=A0A8T1VMN3_9STRA|nr:Eukaryotic translation initiation factor 2-alpha kinase [Phytophthora pseudosyringae]